jgi:alpha-beta hydrolase superfamily lysophospholipase
MTRGQWSIAHANEFPLPLLLMQGTDDHLVSLEATRQFAQAAPQEFIIYKEWQGFYHELHNEPEKLQVFQFIHKWIKTILLS